MIHYKMASNIPKSTGFSRVEEQKVDQFQSSEGGSILAQCRSQIQSSPKWVSGPLQSSKGPGSIADQGWEKNNLTSLDILRLDWFSHLQVHKCKICKNKINTPYLY